MEKNKTSHRIKSVILWSIISAAFIGPGTITTASKAGHSFGYSLIWALVFSIFATIILQEASARISLSTRKNLGEILRELKVSPLIAYFLFIAVSIGCAAYEAGNILGAVSGIQLLSDLDSLAITGLICFISGIVLWFNQTKVIGVTMSIVVAIMGGAFLVLAAFANIDWAELIRGLIIPSFPENSSLIIVALVGTTIVPYNLFIANGLKHDQNLEEMRFGLNVSIIIGGLISLAVLIVGTQISGAFSFEAIMKQFKKIPFGGASLFGVGMFCAGLSSAITAPFAAGIAAQSVFGNSLSPNKIRFIRFATLGIGASFAFLKIKPIPIIILAQALNGVLLPFIALLILWIYLNKQLIPDPYKNSTLRHLSLNCIVVVSVFLGSVGFCKALNSIGPVVIEGNTLLKVSLCITGIIMLSFYRFVYTSD